MDINVDLYCTGGLHHYHLSIQEEMEVMDTSSSEDDDEDESSTSSDSSSSDEVFIILIVIMSYCLVGLVVPKMEELISRPFVGLLKFRWLVQDRMKT